MTRPLSVLIVEDSPTDAKLIAAELRKAHEGLVFDRVDSADGLAAALHDGEWDVVICDWKMPGFSASAALAQVTGAKLDVPFIIVSGSVGEETAVQAMRSGAHDYVLKDRLARLAPAVERELREHQERKARRRAEHQLRQIQKMDAIGSLAGGIAHDFNNVLSVILGYSAMLCEALKPGDPLREDIEQIHSAGEHAADLTRQLLAFSRQQILQPKVLSLNSVVTGVEPMLRRLIGENIELTILVDAGLGLARVDPNQMEQVIMNVVVNARDAMPAGGKLTIETTNADLDDHYASEHLGATAGPHVMLAITDTGSGMDSETAMHMFDPFFTTKKEGKGTGLGLAMVFGIVKQSGGNIWVYSERDEGTTIKMYFPRVDRAEDSEWEAPKARPGASMRGTETVLLVEDDERVRKLAQVILRRHGYHVLEARNGGEALLICEQHKATIHLLLTDVVMPRMGGRELSERLKQIRPEMRVLYISGYTDNSIVHHGVLDSGVAFLQKPLKPDRLTKKVREVLDAAK
jgi:signal transduction histidine kinase